MNPLDDSHESSLPSLIALLWMLLSSSLALVTNTCLVNSASVDCTSRAATSSTLSAGQIPFQPCLATTGMRYASVESTRLPGQTRCGTWMASTLSLTLASWFTRLLMVIHAWWWASGLVPTIAQRQYFNCSFRQFKTMAFLQDAEEIAAAKMFKWLTG